MPRFIGRLLTAVLQMRLPLHFADASDDEARLLPSPTARQASSVTTAPSTARASELSLWPACARVTAMTSATSGM